MKLLKASGISGKYRAARRGLLPALLMCGALAAAAEKQVIPAARTAAFVVAAADSPEQARAQADYVCPGRDDHLVINTAIAALPANGGNVRLAEGTYSIGGVEGTYGGVSIHRGNVLLTGAGSGTRLILQGGLTNINVIWIYGDNIRDVTIRDLYINGNGTNHTRLRSEGWNGCNGVKAIGKTRVRGRHPIYPPRNIRVENCHIENCRLMAVMLSGDVIEVLGCFFTGNFGSHVVELLDSYGRIEGCTLQVKDGEKAGFGFSTDACNNYHIINNKILVAAGGEIRSHAINNWRYRRNGVIAGNMVINNGQSGSVRIQGNMDMVHNNIFSGVAVEIQGQGIMFEDNMLISSPLKINPAGQWPVQITGNWFYKSAVTNSAGNIIWDSNQTTLTDNAGMAVLAGGTNAVVVEHGLAAPPAVVHVSAADTAGAGIKCRIEEITGRQFTIRADADPETADAAFYWRAVNEWKDKSGRVLPAASR
ncbi:MAG: hypothetical protein PHW60_06285 [Kiritimatiellae bacterium]|nr:hypothetical protein [Kiritimatiellia bacterium]